MNPAAIYVVNKIYNPTNNCVCIKYLRKISNHIYNPPINVCHPERNGASHCAAQLCVHIICIVTNNDVIIKYINQISYKFINISSHGVLFNQLSLLAAIHLLSHLTTKSKISVRWIKKLVDNTMFIYL